MHDVTKLLPETNNIDNIYVNVTVICQEIAKTLKLNCNAMQRGDPTQGLTGTMKHEGLTMNRSKHLPSVTLQLFLEFRLRF